jgi:hypothetical protein
VVGIKWPSLRSLNGLVVTERWMLMLIIYRTI